MPTGAETPLSPRVARFFVRLEKYGVSAVHAALVWQRVQFMRTLPGAYRQILAAGHAPAHAAGIYFASLVKHGLLVVLLSFVAVALLCNRPPRELPNKLGQVLVPLIASFFFVLYAVVDHAPDALRLNLLPDAWQPVCALAGLVCSLTGYAVCLWALCHLRRSFALWVSVREVVTGGPYRYVRHPIYLGYFLDQIGLLLASGSLGYLLLSWVYAMFQIQRARMEESKLGEASRDYRLYTQRTGFLLPRWR